MSAQAENRATFASYLDTFAEMQNDHLQQLSAGRINKLNDWLDQRRKSLMRLQQYFESINNKSLDESFRKYLLMRLKKIIDRENQINRKAGQIQKSVHNNLQHIRKGRSVVSGYSLKNDQTVPKFLSSKG